MAPELLLTPNARTQLGVEQRMRSDMWSLACILLSVYTGYDPWSWLPREEGASYAESEWLCELLEQGLDPLRYIEPKEYRQSVL